jgi:hypothetical protein
MVILIPIGFPSPVGSLVLLSLAAALAVTFTRSLPRAFLVDCADHATGGPPPPTSPPPADDVPSRSAEAQASTSSSRQLTGRWLLHATVVRLTYANLAGWPLLLCILGYCAICTAEYHRGGNHSLAMILVSIWIVPSLRLGLSRLRQLDPLPVPRRVLFADIVAPALAAVALGVILASLGPLLAAETPRQVHISDGRIEVPFEFWQVTTDGTPAPVSAPWGEEHTPTAVPLFRGGRIAVYNPFEIARSSSPRFADRQLRRALAEVYATSMPPSRLDEGFGAPTSHRSLAAAYPQEGASPRRSRTLPVEILILIVANTALLLLFLQQFAGGRHARLFRWAAIAVAGLLIATVAVFFVASMAGLANVIAAGAILAIAISRLGELIPLPVGLLWAAVAVSAVAAYVLVRSRFEHLEAPESPLSVPPGDGF